MKKYDKILTIGLLVLEVFYYILIKQLPEKAAKYPYFVLGLLIFLTLILAVNSFLIKAKTSEEDEKFKDIKIWQFLFIILTSTAYIYLIEVVGFFVTTFVYLLIVMIGLKSSIKWSIITSVVFPIFLYLVFVSFLRVPVPRGFLI